MRPFTLTFLVTLAPVAAVAQVDSATAALPQPGAEVRVTTRVGRMFYGHLDQATADSIRIRTAGANDRTVVTAIPRDSIARFEVNHPGGGHGAVGALIGAGAGLSAGAALAALNCPLGFCSADTQSQNVKDTELAMIVGGVIGALTGAGIRSSHWSEVAAERVRVTAGPAGGGLGVGLTLRF